MESTVTVGKTIILLQTPRALEGGYGKFEAFFTDLHKLLKGKTDVGLVEKMVSCELVFSEGYLRYRLVLSSQLAPFVKALLHTHFSGIEVTDEPFNDQTEPAHSSICQFILKRSNYFPLKTSFDSNTDPYLNFAAVLSKLEHFHETVVLQVLLIPKTESWFTKFWREYFAFIRILINNITLFMEKPFLERASINYREEISSKFAKPVFLANLRLLVTGQNQADLQENTSFFLKALEKFDNGDINALSKTAASQTQLLQHFSQHSMIAPEILLNTAEVAALYHFPDTTLGITNVDHALSKKSEPPKTLPLNNFLQSPTVSVFATTNAKGQSLSFGIKREDRNKHMYIIGKTGMGKSRLMQLLAISDIMHGKGLCIIDPHGDLASGILRFVPQERITDVIYFNPADALYPVGFNPLECFTPEAKHQVVTGFIAIFKKLFAATWTNRLEHMLRFTVLALLETDNATVIDIVRLLTDITFRQQVVRQVQDPVVKNFWTHEFSAWNEKFDNEAIIPLVNQVGQFISNDYIRYVVGQKHSKIHFYDAMNEGKIIIINLAKGKLGEENAALLGSMIITKIQEAAMSRVDIPEQDRREFYLYVDEFQNFATESFNQILSEARKFNVSLTIAHQYIDQLSESIRKTAFGNIGSLISFRVGSEDAHYLAHEFSPIFSPDDLINLSAREIGVKLSIDGKTSEPFSARTIDVPDWPENWTEQIVRHTRTNYARPREEVAQELFGDGQALKKDYIGHAAFEEPLV